MAAKNTVCKNTDTLSPVLKWAGGKRQLLDTLRPLFPAKIDSYCEPFVGGGAVLFALSPKTAYVNDINKELINLYKVIKDDVKELILLLKEYKNDEKYFYLIRNIDRNCEEYSKLSNTQKAARILYLNRTCFNGLYRVNRKGEFNVPFGRYNTPDIVNERGLLALHNYFNNNEIHFTSNDYNEVLSRIPDNTFVYLDPPYYPISNTSNFIQYTQTGFSHDEHIRLKNMCDILTARDIKFMMSNSSAPFIRELYSKYDITEIQARRAINSKASGRGNVKELVIKNY